jgi:cell division protease FtsH
MRLPRISSNVIIGMVFVAMAIAGLNNSLRKNVAAVEAPSIPYSDFLDLTRDNKVVGVVFNPQTETVRGATIPAKGSLDKLGRFTSRVPAGALAADWMSPLIKNGVRIEITPLPVPSMFGDLLVMLIPTALLLMVMVWMMRRQERMNGVSGMGGRGGLQNFIKPRTNMVDPAQNNFRLKDVEGIEDAKAEIEEVVRFLRDPADYLRVGARVPRGVLLSGPPGSGKTLLAKAMAGEAGVAFYSASGSDFVEMFVGVGASRVRELFRAANEHGSAIIFIDEIDAVGRQRGASAGGSNEEREQTLNALLVEMDGFASSAGVVVLAATNRPDVLDAALRRPGRFDRDVVVSLPDLEGRERILSLHGQKVPTANDVDWKVVARGAPGFSGADLANLVNEAALHAAREKRALVVAEDFEWARDKVLMGNPRAGIRNAFERKATAVHEAGHAVVARFSPEADPVHKITILPRGRSLGLTMQLPEADVYNYSRTNLLSRVAVLMGGRSAEEVVLNLQSVGASNDFARATQVARQMVGAWGMSEIGPISFDGERGTHSEWWSEGVRQKVDEAVMQILREQHLIAHSILTTQRVLLDGVTEALLEHETVDAGMFEELVKKFAPNAPPASVADTLAPVDEAFIPQNGTDEVGPIVAVG